MKITRIDVFRFGYTAIGGGLTLSGGRVARGQDSTIVKVSTDEGLVGWGEECPFSPTYMVAFAEGARAAIREIAPALLGADPRQIEPVYARMDGVLQGHAYAKSALDMACWDLLGQAVGLPVSELLGGTFHPEFPLYTMVSVGPPERMREEARGLLEQGYRRAQIKVGGDWREDVRRVRACLEVLGDMEVVIADANAHWRQHEAAQVVAALEDTPIYVEQPCRPLAACVAVRRRSQRPFILDESLSDLDALLEARRADGMDAAMLKLSRFGGISRLRLARDLCQQWGLAVTIEDSGGGDIVSAAMAHLAASTRPGHLLNGSLINVNVNEHLADGPHAERGRGRAPTGPGLGIRVDEAALGAPLFTVR
ncbi:MAG TPA: mandelate racemase/muconate lactonizing enzyme family protein [Methylomirabilota bacterium]|jgi:L-alanine-DL-glutamate epimerase-like enolase superfamily enzyme|nr:mandelate racemase/muconate lactonizing enzyme family protein [Methylomirabilota bacterium]